MLDVVVNMFTRQNPRRNAALALTRIMNRFDMAKLGYDEGLTEDRRSRDERHVAMGVWLFPCGPNDRGNDFSVAGGVPAVTHDLRSQGFGIMTPVKLKHQNFIVAAPDEENWRFFRSSVAHNTRKQGGWYQLGLHVDRSIEMDSIQRGKFRAHIEAVQADSV